MMKAKMDDIGELYIFRKGVWSEQYCPYTQDPCGDQCPMFFEVEAREAMQVEGMRQPAQPATIELRCSTQHTWFKLEIDERDHEEDEQEI